MTRSKIMGISALISIVLIGGILIGLSIWSDSSKKYVPGRDTIAFWNNGQFVLSSIDRYYLANENGTIIASDVKSYYELLPFVLFTSGDGYVLLNCDTDIYTVTEDVNSFGEYLAGIFSDNTKFRKLRDPNKSRSIWDLFN